jgi:tRNA threonylcarbamoyl adenosine modification protein (Sua5/YciO/YrdC/YwlC family)
MILDIHPDNPDPRKLKMVLECLNDGGIIIYPTDTVYSIGCSLYKNKAMEKVAKLKGVKLNKAKFSIICYDLSNLSVYTKQVDTPTYKLLKKALPGPFTFILPASGKVPKLFMSNKKTVGLRIPDNNIPREIVKELGHPIIATSIRDEDEILEYTTDPELIHEKYENQVDIVIDGGYGNNEASTVIDCTGRDPELIRQGIGIIEGYFE